MRISELASHTGLSVATIKYYLREGLLHPGRAMGATRADYDETHVDRVRLVRTLITVGGLSIERVRAVIQALEHPPASRHDLLGTAHEVLRPASEVDDEPVARQLVDLLGWPLHGDSPAVLQLAAAITTARAGGWDCPDALLVQWAGLARQIAEVDVSDELATMPAAEALSHAIVGTVLTDPILIALRRVAQQAVSAERLARR